MFDPAELQAESPLMSYAEQQTKATLKARIRKALRWLRTTWQGAVVVCILTLVILAAAAAAAWVGYDYPISVCARLSEVVV